MVNQQILNDAALALSRILTFHRLHHAFFGGFAILSKGGNYRESKDLDVLLSCPKSQITSILTSKRGWLEIPQTREDYVAYFWNNTEYTTAVDERASMVLVELFVGVDKSSLPKCGNVVVSGRHLGTSYIPVVNEETLFRGKVNAASTRAKVSDMQDIKWLVEKYPKLLKQSCKKIDKQVVGLAVKRHPGLRKVLEKAGVQTRAAVWSTRKVKIEVCGGVKKWDVHRGLGCVV